jgi:hypothetical protein
MAHQEVELDRKKLREEYSAIGYKRQMRITARIRRAEDDRLFKLVMADRALQRFLDAAKGE